MHAKKVVVADPLEGGAEVVAGSEVNDPIPEAPASSSSYARMDNEMSEILQNTKLSEFDKWILYQQVLERYLRKLQSHKNSKTAVARAQAFFNKETEGSQKNKNNFDSLDALKEFTIGSAAIKSRLFYGILEKSSCISWDATGRVSIMGTPSGASIKDYIEASMKRSIKTKPQGWDLFVAALRSLKIPSGYVNNLQLQDVLKQAGSPPRTQSATSLPLPQFTDGFAAVEDVDKHVRNTRSFRWTPY